MIIIQPTQPVMSDTAATRITGAKRAIEAQLDVINKRKTSGEKSAKSQKTEGKSSPSATTNKDGTKKKSRNEKKLIPTLPKEWDRIMQILATALVWNEALACHVLFYGIDLVVDAFVSFPLLTGKGEGIGKLPAQGKYVLGASCPENIELAIRTAFYEFHPDQNKDTSAHLSGEAYSWNAAYYGRKHFITPAKSMQQLGETLQVLRPFGGPDNAVLPNVARLIGFNSMKTFVVRIQDYFVKYPERLPQGFGDPKFKAIAELMEIHEAIVGEGNTTVIDGGSVEKAVKAVAEKSGDSEDDE